MMEEIEVDSKWKDCLGKANYSKDGVLLKGRLERIITIINKTGSTIQYRDSGGFISWISFDDFTRIEKSNNLIRFEKIG